MAPNDKPSSSGHLPPAELSSGSSSLNEKNDGIKVLTWDGPNDKRLPLNWSNVRKWLTCTILLLNTLLLPLNGTGITVAADQLAEEFNVTDSKWFTNTYWIVSSWSVGGCFVVLFAMSWLEDLGIKKVFLAFSVFNILMIVPQAVAQNYATLVVTRFFSGGCTAVLANAISSVIADLWDTAVDRSLPTAIYILFYVFGNTAGPPIFAYVVPATDNWRWVFYIQIIVYCALLPFAFLLPETRHDKILKDQAKKMRKKTGQEIYGPGEFGKKWDSKRIVRSTFRAPKMFFKEPLLFFCTLWSAFAFGNVFVFTQSTELVFSQLYGWNQAQCGLIQSAILIGEVLGFPLCLAGIRLYIKSASRNTEEPGTPIPEARLYVAIFASFFLIAGGMFEFAWTTYAQLPWIAPAIGLAMAGAGQLIVVSAAADYVIDAYAMSGFAGSAISAAAACENLSAGFLPLVTQPMYTGLGIHWASTLLACVALLVSMAPVSFLFFGRRMRESSPSNRMGREELAQQDMY